MKLETNTTINGTVVDYVGKVDKLKVFSTELDIDTTLYFVNEQDIVVSTLKIDTEMGQGVGYVSELILRKV